MRRRSQPPAVPPPAAPDISGRRKLLLAGALLLLYGTLATWGQFDFSDLMGYYNLLADGFLAGHLYVGPTPDQGSLQDMIPYQGHYYAQISILSTY